MIKKLSMISVSDIHLGHQNVETSFIINNLNKYLFSDKILVDLDIIWICGDVFDQILYFSDDVIGEIEYWMIQLLKVCKKWDITLRILEGTPSHDRGQSIHFIRKAEMFAINVDVKYIDTLCIEYIEKFDIHVLYIPDEYHITTDKTWTAVQELMMANNLSKVDFAIMHGMFEHQLPPGLKSPVHCNKKYQDIVRKYIFVGHVHQSSRDLNILSNGSFDRLSHGDEGDKGFWRVTTYNESYNDELTFIINQDAKIFHTVSWHGLSPDVVLEETRTKIKNYPSGSFIRIEMMRDPIFRSLFEVLRKEFHVFHWSEKLSDGKNSHDVSVRLKTIQPIPINANTITSIVKERLSLMGIEQSEQHSIIELLDKIK